MANKIQIRRGSSNNFVGQSVCQGELIWLNDIEKLYIGTTGTAADPVTVGITQDGKYTNVKVISPDASEVAYDNTDSGLAATNVQDAIDELKDDLDTAVNTLDEAKQDRPQSAVSGNIAIFNGTKDTIDSGKTFVTSVGGTGTDTNIPTEKAIRTAITNALTAAVNYKGMCKESQLPTSGQKLGDFWSISDFDTSYPNQNRNGRAIWNDGTTTTPAGEPHWDKEVDEYLNPDETTIDLNTNGKLEIKPFSQTDTTSTQTATYSGTVNVVDSITRNGYGQVTGINVKTVTMPSLGKQANQAAKGDEAEYIINKVTTIRNATGANPATDTNYPTEKAVRIELDKKANKSNITASQNFSLVQYNSDGIVTSSTDVIDGGTF